MLLAVWAMVRSERAQNGPKGQNWHLEGQELRPPENLSGGILILTDAHKVCEQPTWTMTHACGVLFVETMKLLVEVP